MSKRKGELIAIEGTDGSGKKTQAGLLISRLQKEGYKVATASFPQYGKKSAGPVEEYLNGKYGKAEAVSPHVASLFFAIDRFDLSKELLQLLNDGHIVILDRYVDSNAGHQGGKIKDDREREKYIRWLYNIEYRIFKIPKPDLVLILHVPAELGQKLVGKKQQRFYIEGTKNQDLHEADLDHLLSAEKSYLWLAKHFPEYHKLIECAKKDILLSPEEIHHKIWSIINEFLRHEAIS